MSELLVVDDDAACLEYFYRALASHHHVVTAVNRREATSSIETGDFDVALVDLQLPDGSGLDLIAFTRDRGLDIPIIMVSGVSHSSDVVSAMRLGAFDFVEKPVDCALLLVTVEAALRRSTGDIDPCTHSDIAAHAAARIAMALLPVIDSGRDTRTLDDWARIAFAATGTIRNWCRMAAISPRRVLVFGRLLRAAAKQAEGHRVENILDVVDRRTLTSLIEMAGFRNLASFPTSIEGFLEEQVLISDADLLRELRTALAERIDAL